MLDRRDVVVRQQAIFRMHHFQIAWARPGFAKTADPLASDESFLLLLAEMEKPQRQHASVIRDLDNQAAAAAEADVRQLNPGQDNGVHALPQCADGRNPGSVLIANRQVIEQISGLLDSQPLQLGCELWADAAERG